MLRIEYKKQAVRFVPEEDPTEEEREAIVMAKADISPTVSHGEINWD